MPNDGVHGITGANTGVIQNLGSSNGTLFTLLPGAYDISALAGAFNSGYVQLSRIGPDGATPIPIKQFTSNGAITLQLSGGQYEFQSSAATSAWASVAPANGNPVW